MSPDAVAAALQSHDDYLITSHINPDGDSLGAQLALGNLLKALGKKATILNHNPAGANYRFLPELDSIRICDDDETPDFKTVVMLDIGEWERMGRVADIVDRDRHYVINIDHHASNNGFGNTAWVDIAACSAALMVFRLYSFLQVRITPDAATQMYTGILTDTGGFRFNNTSAEALEACARLTEAGAEPARIMEQAYFTKSLLAVNVFRKVLDSLRLEADGKVAVAVLRLADLTVWQPHTEADVWAATEGIIDYIRSIQGVEVALFFREEHDGIKVSLRSVRDSLDVNDLARKYDGGGHAQAAGAFLDGDPEDGIRRVTADAVSLVEK